MRTWKFLQRWADESPVGVLVAAFLMVLFVLFVAMLPASVLTGETPKVSPSSLFADYERAIVDSAIKKPEYRMRLATIDRTKPEVVVNTFRYPSLQSGTLKLPSPMWVSLPAQLKAACSGVRDAKRALQQILGLPPTSGPQAVYEISAPSADIIRPCMRGSDTTATSCSFDFPAVPDPQLEPLPATATAAQRDAAYTPLREAYDRLRPDYDRVWFLANQMWTSYRIGFPADHFTAGDYPYSGYPFTGMGWTYNWNRQSGMHVGVTEFVIPKGVEVAVGPAMMPDDFCRAR